MQVNIRAARQWAAVTPDDDADLPAGITGLWVGGVGDVAAVDRYGVTAVFTAVPAGTLLPISPARVLEASTATLIIALYD